LRDIQAALREFPERRSDAVASGAVIGAALNVDPAVLARLKDAAPESIKLPDWAKLRDGEKAVRTYSQNSTKGQYTLFTNSPSPLVVTNQRLLFRINSGILISLELKNITTLEKAQVNILTPTIRIQTNSNDQYFLILFATALTYENREKFIALIEQLRAAL
jgi:hypothetical protein